MKTSPLIPDEAREQIGQLMHDPVTVEITARDSQRYAMAVDDLDPVYFDEEAATRAGHRTLVAPPTFLSHAVAVANARPLSELREDGLYKGGRHLPRVLDAVGESAVYGEELGRPAQTLTPPDGAAPYFSTVIRPAQRQKRGGRL